METWDEPKNRSPGCIPHSFRLVCLGGTGRGKTCAMKNLFLQHQSTSRKFKKLFIVTCDADCTEWLDCEPDGVFDEMPDPKMFDTGEKTMLIIDDFEFARMGSDSTRKLATLFRFISTHKSVYYGQLPIVLLPALDLPQSSELLYNLQTDFQSGINSNSESCWDGCARSQTHVQTVLY